MAPLVMAVLGSPRLVGNSAVMLETFCQGVSDAGGRVELYNLARLRIAPCQACGGCEQDGECVVQDDMVGLYRALERVDGLVLAAPVYFGTINAQTKAFIDRCQALWARRFVLDRPPLSPGKKCFYLCVGGRPTLHYCQNALAVLKNLCYVLNMELAGHLAFPGVDKPGEIIALADALRQVRQAGKEFTRSLVQKRE
ncbi:MAG: flavodoxin family protein [Bacillota bacterium]|uniref:flavodoxin family protein n=1 Tax=Desulfurispora thermophila TaxID=265470 RepID=UPI00037E328E|nr:flavodoxin family protein [Desulfurispora thermophila]